jgi:chromosome segregation ATPase
MEIILEGGTIMELSVILELIGSVGFPIACVLALGVFVFKIYNQSVEREKTLMAEITENRLVNEKAIETIAKYAERLTHIEDNITEIKNDVTEIKTKIQ